MEMASPVRSSQNLASSTSTRLEPGNSPANRLIFSLVQPSTAPGNFLIGTFTPSSSGSTARFPPSQSTTSSHQIRRRCVEVGGTITWKGAFRLFLYWLYWSLMNYVRARMSCLPAFKSRVRRAKWRVSAGVLGYSRLQQLVVSGGRRRVG